MRTPTGVAEDEVRGGEVGEGGAGEEKQRATRRKIFAVKQKDTHAKTARDTRRVKGKETQNVFQCDGNTHADTHARTHDGEISYRQAMVVSVHCVLWS